MTKPIVFLDFDGVLIVPSQKGFGLAQMRYLNRIWITTDCEFVISSTWRTTYSREELAAMLYKAGLLTDAVVRDVTPSLTRFSPGGIAISATRWQEIERWLRRYEVFCGEWCIMDDFCTGCPPEERYIECDGNIGLTSADADRVIDILQGRL